MEGKEDLEFRPPERRSGGRGFRVLKFETTHLTKNPKLIVIFYHKELFSDFLAFGHHDEYDRKIEDFSAGFVFFYALPNIGLIGNIEISH